MAGSNTIVGGGGWEGSQEVISYEMCIFNNALEGIKEMELLYCGVNTKEKRGKT